MTAAVVSSIVLTVTPFKPQAVATFAELDPELSYAKVADACGLKGVTVRTMDETTNAIKQSCEDQKKGITTFIEVILNQELGEPFRRDAMKKPVKVAGINKKDMRKQPSLIS